MNNLEIFGLRCEVAGLILVLVATVWQVIFTDWFEKNSREWIAYIQEDVNIAILESVNELSSQINESDPVSRSKLAAAINERTAKAISKAIAEREHRVALEKGQAAIFGKIRLVLVAFGAALVLLGKYLVLQHKKVASVSRS